MAAVEPDLKHCIVRILAGDLILGTGFLAAPGLVCTSARVVARTFSPVWDQPAPPAAAVLLDFPYLPAGKLSATVLRWEALRADGGGDIAILRLSGGQPPGARPARCLPGRGLRGRKCVIWGFPPGLDFGDETECVLGHTLADANGSVQLEANTGGSFQIRPGYAGAPVWDTAGRGVVGMVAGREGSPAIPATAMVPSATLRRFCPEIRVAEIARPFPELTDGLSGSLLSSIEEFLAQYAGTPQRPAPFGGRDPELQELNEWLAAPGEPYALLLAQAGQGKSALLTRWAQRIASAGDGLVALAPVSIRFGTARRSALTGLLRARLGQLLEVPGEGGPPADPDLSADDIQMYLREDQDPGRPLVVVLDGVDEAVGWAAGQELRFPIQPGSGVKVVVSARGLGSDAPLWERRLGWQAPARRLALGPLTLPGVAEVLRSVGAAELASQPEAIRELHRLSEGDPLLTRLYIEALQGEGAAEAWLSPDRLSQIKPGLQAYFGNWWRDWQAQWNDRAVPTADVQAVLALLARAQGPLSREDLVWLAQPEGLRSALALRETLRPLERWIIGDGEELGYVFSHPRLSEYFREETMPPGGVDTWEQRFLTYGEQAVASLAQGGDLAQPSRYVVQNYAVHLELADAPAESFGPLVTREWQQAWQRTEDTYDGFLGDVSRAWRHAEDGARSEASQASQAGGLAAPMALESRCAFVTASVSTLVSGIPANLLVALVKARLWSAAEALAYAVRSRDAYALTELAPLISQEPRKSFLIADALAAVRMSSRPPYSEFARAEALMAFAPFLPEDERLGAMSEAVDEAFQWQGSWFFQETSAYERIARDLPPELLAEFLGRLYGTGRPYLVFPTLIALAPCLPAALLAEAMTWVRSVIDDWPGAPEALAGLASYLPEDVRQAAIAEVLEVIRSHPAPDLPRALARLVPHLEAGQREEVADESVSAAAPSMRAAIKAEVAPHLSGPARDRLFREVLGELGDLASESGQHPQLMRVVSQLPEPMLGAAVDVVALLADSRDRLGLLRAIAQRIPGALVAQAAAVARANLDEVSRAQVLTALAARAAPQTRDLLLREALGLARRASGSQKVLLLTDVASELEGEERSLALREALEASRVIHDEPIAAPVLRRLAQGLPQEEIRGLVSQVQAMRDAGWKAHFLLELAGLLDGPDRGRIVDEAMAAGLSLRDPYRRYGALKALLPHVQDGGRLQAFTEALESIADQPDDQARSHALADLAPDLPAALLQRAVTLARQIGEPLWKVQALISLLPRVSSDERHGLSEEALSAVETMTEVDRDWAAVAGLVAQLPDALLPRVVSTLHGHAYGGLTDVIAVLLGRLPATSVSELAELARALPAPGQQSAILAMVAAAAPQPLSRELRTEAVDAALLLPIPSIRARALADLIDDLEPEERPGVVAQALAACRDEKDPAVRADDLFQLAHHAGAGERTAISGQGVEALESIADEDSRAGNLIALADTGTLPDEALPGALGIARAMQDPGRKAAALAALAPWLGEQISAALAEEALQAALSAGLPRWRARALASLLPLLSGDDRVTALLAALRVYPQCGDFVTQASLGDAMTTLPGDLPLGTPPSRQMLHDLWSGMLRGTAHDRHEFLTGLRSAALLAARIGGASTAAATARAFIEVCDWFS
jgi:hypothetical protein